MNNTENNQKTNQSPIITIIINHKNIYQKYKLLIIAHFSIFRVLNAFKISKEV